MICPECQYTNQFNDDCICSYCGYNMMPKYGEVYKLAKRFEIVDKTTSYNYGLKENEFLVGIVGEFKRELALKQIPFHTKAVYGLQVIVIDL